MTNITHLPTACATPPRNPRLHGPKPRGIVYLPVRTGVTRPANSASGATPRWPTATSCKPSPLPSVRTT